MLSSAAPAWLWVVFGVGVTAVMLIDLGLFNRKEHAVSTKSALSWVMVWLSLAVAFGAGVGFWLGHDKALEFFTGYVVEQALSVDNLFVFIVVFQFFRVPKEYQHRVLFWGVIGAFVLRAIFIFVGAALVQRFTWILWVFGAFLIYTGIKLLLSSDDDAVDPGDSAIVRLVRRLFPVTDGFDGGNFLTKQDGRTMATQLMLVLMVVEATDVVFAFDSIPAIFGITTDPFIVYTSNIFAILGLRNLYFVLADFMDRFEYLKVGLGLVLSFVGAKMVVPVITGRLAEMGIVFTHETHIPVGVSLAVIAFILLASVLFSLWKSRGASPVPKA